MRRAPNPRCCCELDEGEEGDGAGGEGRDAHAGYCCVVLVVVNVKRG